MEKVRLVFEELLKSTTIENVDSILRKAGINEKYWFKKEQYPELNFQIAKEEIDELKTLGIITQENLVAENIPNMNPLAKLLYAFLWKNGDLKKIKHIINGIFSDRNDVQEEGLVFYHFGKHLADAKNEPIIDQHVLRAFEKWINETKPLLSRKGTNINTRKMSLILEYKEWMRVALPLELRQNEKYPYHVDKVLFALGKYIKDCSEVDSRKVSSENVDGTK